MSNLTIFHNFEITIGRYARKIKDDYLGYEVFEVGPENARAEYYWNSSEKIFFICDIFLNNNKRDGVCNDTMTLYDCNAVDFSFPVHEIPELGNIEHGVRELLFGFQQDKEISCPK